MLRCIVLRHRYPLTILVIVLRPFHLLVHNDIGFSLTFKLLHYYRAYWCLIKRTRRNQRVNQNPYIEEKQKQNGQKHKRTNNDLQNMHIKLKIKERRLSQRGAFSFLLGGRGWSRLLSVHDLIIMFLI